jgi:hypothetical protein
LEVQTAGDPDDEEILFTDLSPRLLAERLDQMGTPVGRDAIATWPRAPGFVFDRFAKTFPEESTPIATRSSRESPN